MNVVVKVNGSPIEIDDGITVAGLLARLELNDGPVAVEVNRDIVTRARHPEHVLSDGDTVEVVRFVGGG
jgi:sulfur carrier protein